MAPATLEPGPGVHLSVKAYVHAVKLLSSSTAEDLMFETR